MNVSASASGSELVYSKDIRITLSRKKILAPFSLDEELVFYSPQDNLDAFRNDKIRDFHEFMLNEYEPQLPKGKAVLLLLPCTRVKPYPASIEHRKINSALLAAGFEPVQRLDVPDELLGALNEHEDPQVLNISPLLHPEKNIVVHRMVVSEPMGLVPYEYVYWWRGRYSPAALYDDPGLFEARGTSVSPWRSDSSARLSSDGKSWRWGDLERAAYVQVHNHIAQLLAAILSRIKNHYSAVIAWVAPGLTHRSFLSSESERALDQIPCYRKVDSRLEKLIGVNDIVNGLVEIHPSQEELLSIRERLTQRLKSERGEISDASIRAYFARGGGGATPIALPEALDVLKEVIFGVG